MMRAKKQTRQSFHARACYQQSVSLWGLFALCMGAAACSNTPEVGARQDWGVYLGDQASSQYSTLDQINRDNVAGLQVAWEYRTGDASPDGRTQIQCNPIIVKGVLYGSSPKLKMFALDAATGAPIWTFDPFQGESELNPLGVNRGVVYWEDGKDKRILFTAGSRLYALHAETGQLIPDFGTGGSVSLHEGLGRDVTGLFVLSNTPGIIYKDLLILGTRVSEGPDAAPGYIRAYNVRTGALTWTFHTIPHPGEEGYETWPEDAWQRIGAANAWTGMSLDEKRGLVFIPTGSAAFDFWGGNRKGENLFANCILALKADTGERVWHFQTVHHDLWDRDLPAAPNLVTVEHNGKRVDAVAQITKSGFVFLLDRETGKPLFSVEERPVPPSDLKGEQAWPTQPFPVKPPPFARQTFTEADVTDISPESQAYVLERLKQTRTGRPFIPPSTSGTMIFPGFDGGGEWGGAAYDPASGLLYVNANEMPWILTMVAVGNPSGTGSASPAQMVYTVNCAACHGIDRKGDQQQVFPSLIDVDQRLSREEVMDRIEHGKGVMPSFGHIAPAEKEALVALLFGEEAPAPAPSTQVSVERLAPDVPYAHTGYNRFLDPDGYPAIKPPWGTLNAIDLNRGEIAWQTPLGEFRELTERGVPQTGTENYGGPIVTAGGLLFIGATKDEKFRAFDKETGKVLWEVELPAGGYATPSTYEVDGKQYVVIAAGGGKMGTSSGDTYVAFALPD